MTVALCAIVPDTYNDVTRNAPDTLSPASSGMEFPLVNPLSVKETYMRALPVGFFTVMNCVTNGKRMQVGVATKTEPVTKGMAEIWYSGTEFGPGGG